MTPNPARASLAKRKQHSAGRSTCARNKEKEEEEEEEREEEEEKQQLQQQQQQLNPDCRKRTHRGARTHDHKVKSLALYQLS